MRIVFSSCEAFSALLSSALMHIKLNIIRPELPGDAENGKHSFCLQGEECVQAENALHGSREDLQARHNASSKPDDYKSSATCSDFPGSKVW